MATAAEIQVAYKAIYRTDLNATVAAAIANSGISVDAYIAQQLPQVASTTQAAVAIASFVTGTAPTSDKLDALKIEADKQVASYTALGVGNPSLGAYEAFGRSFATDATTTAGFNTKYGALSTADFIAVVYAQVYGTQPSAGAAANLTAQINYFTSLYTTNGVANAALAAKGAVLGQIVGYAFTSSASANSNLDNQVQSLLTSAAKGDTTVYNKALPTVVDPGQTGVTITLATTGDTVSLNAADPALKSTAFNDTINGSNVTFTTANNTAKIDGGAGDDVANLKYDGTTAVKLSQLINVETLNLNATVAGNFDVDAATGLKSVGFTDSAANGTVVNIAAGVNLSVIDTTAVTAGPPAVLANTKNATFVYKDATGSADSANLTVSGLDTPGAVVSVAGIETLKITAGAASSTFTLADAELKDLSLTAAKDLTIAGFGTSTALETVTASGSGAVTLTGNIAATVKSIDASGLTGATGISFTTAANANNLTSVKGGAGADVFTITSTTKAVAIDTGAGNDVFTFNSSNTTAGAVLGEVKSGSGNDQVTLGSTGIANGVAATQKVTLGQGGDTLILNDVGNVSTTIVYAAGDSTSSFQDSITNFKAAIGANALTGAADKIDITAFALTNQTVAKATIETVAPTTDQANLFAGNATQIIAYSVGGDVTLLIDSNKDGSFNAGTDTSIKLIGVDYTKIDAGNFVFA